MKIKLEQNKKRVNQRFHILAIICIAIFAIGIVPRTLQNDTYYTITLGKYVLEHGIDMMEHFSWHAGLIYTYPHWLYDIFIYGIYHIGGFTGIYISTIILAMLLGISMYIVGVKVSKNNIVAFLVTILLLYFGKDYIAARAQLVTFILFVWTIYFIEQFLDTKKKRYAIGLILIPIAIANIHAAVFPFYFVLYLPYIGEYIIAIIKEHKDFITKLLLKLDKKALLKLENKETLSEKEIKTKDILAKRIAVNTEKLEQKNKKQIKKEYKIIIEKRNNVKWLIVIMLVCIFTGFLTPIGDTPYTYLLHTMKGNTTGNIGEHLPLTLANNRNAIIIIAFYVILLPFTKVKIRLRDLFLAGGLLALSFKTRRQLSMFYFIGGFVLMRLIDNFIYQYSTEKMEEEIEQARQYMTSWIGQAISYLLIIALTICLWFNIKDTKIVNNESYPVAASDYIVKNLNGKDIKLFNDYNFGSYLMYRGIPVFIDSRADVYDPQFNGFEDDIFQDYINIAGLNCDYDLKFDHYGITHVITYSNSKLALYMQKDATHNLEIYRDDYFVIFERLDEKDL